MRRTLPEPVALQDHTTHSLFFAGANGERLRLDVLDTDLIRVQHLPDGQYRLARTWLVAAGANDVPRHGRQRDDLTGFPLPKFDLSTRESGITVTTRSLTVDIHLPEFRLKWHNSQGDVFAADLPQCSYPYDTHTGAVSHYLSRLTDECYYGFGETSGPLNKAGRRIRMLNTDALAYNAETSNPLYKHWPFYITLLPELNTAYGLLYDNLSETVFDLGCEINAVYGPYRYYQAAAGDLDYYLIYGPTVASVVEKLAWLIGRPALLPRWSLGYLGSTMHYTEQPDAQSQLTRFAALCEAHEIPCDMFHLSSGYTTDEAGRRCVFTWNRSKIPDPRVMAEGFHHAGIRLAANVKPHLLTCHPDYSEVTEIGAFVRDSHSGEPHLVQRWSGGIYEAARGSYVDFTSEAGFDWWKAKVRATLLAYGIDAIWNDNNEFDSQDDSADCAGFGTSIPFGLARPLQTLLMARASYEAMLDEMPTLRPYVITRAGCPGVQRYAQTWSGDNTTSWHTLRYNIPMGLGLSLSGMSNAGHDVGGFAGGRPDPELFVRWVQNGIFHPRFTIHSLGDAENVSEPWMYPAVLPHVRAALEFRYRLIPYLYTLLFKAAYTGAPVIRPLVYHFQQDPVCRDESFDFMLGPNLLVASVLEPGARSRRVYLPAGRWWCDFFTGKWYAGGQEIEVPAPLERIPLFVPDGGMIPTGKLMRYVGEKSDDVRRVYVFPHPTEGVGKFVLVEDDGISLAYRDGMYTRLRLQVSAFPSHIVVGTASVQGPYKLPYNHIEFVLPHDEERRLEATDGHEYTDNDNHRCVVVPLKL